MPSDLIEQLCGLSSRLRSGLGLTSLADAKIIDAAIEALTPLGDDGLREAVVTDAMKRAGAFAGAAYGFPNLYHPNGELLEEIYRAMQAALPLQQSG